MCVCTHQHYVLLPFSCLNNGVTQAFNLPAYCPFICPQGVQRVARSGVTVAAVIHQPAYETFCMFDDLVLLAKGGMTAYYGPQADVQVGLLKRLVSGGG